jgi:hypothetical protein
VPDLIFADPVLVVSVNQSYPKRSAYDAARFAWRVSAERARKVRYVVAVKKREVVGVFEPSEWKPATRANFPEFDQEFPGRVGFVGTTANEDALRQYIGRKLTADFKFSGNGYRYAGPEPDQDGPGDRAAEGRAALGLDARAPK